LGVKATLFVSAAISIGGVAKVSALATATAVSISEVPAMRNSIAKYLKYASVWCGAALLWRPGGVAPPIER
jgi:hypothetical protein